MKYLLEAGVSLGRIMSQVSDKALDMLKDGVVQISVERYEDEKDRSLAQNRMIYKIYGRIGKTLYGGDELHARRECKLKIGCRILYRDSKDFARTFDDCIRPLSHDKRLRVMDLIEVSSIMKVKQSTEYIKSMIQIYGEQNVYFADLEGVEEYAAYPEASV